MFVSTPTYSYVEIITPNVTVLGSGVLGGDEVMG